MRKENCQDAKRGPAGVNRPTLCFGGSGSAVDIRRFFKTAASAARAAVASAASVAKGIY
jgi:hypothetical protein